MAKIILEDGYLDKLYPSDKNNLGLYLKTGYYGLISATHFGETAPPISV